MRGRGVLVGNLAAQMFELAGCEVIAFDTVPRRLALRPRVRDRERP
jgi:hypothetical protein